MVAFKGFMHALQTGVSERRSTRSYNIQVMTDNCGPEREVQLLHFDSEDETTLGVLDVGSIFSIIYDFSSGAWHE